MTAMPRKKVISSLGLVSTAREGGSQLWEVKGREVSIVRVVESSAADEMGRRREGVQYKPAEMGFRKLDRDEAAARDRAMWICGN